MAIRFERYRIVGLLSGLFAGLGACCTHCKTVAHLTLSSSVSGRGGDYNVLVDSGHWWAIVGAGFSCCCARLFTFPHAILLIPVGIIFIAMVILPARGCGFLRRWLNR